jgi:molecular chaperone DnaK
MANDNKEVGRFDLTDIPPAPRGVPQIEVSFDVDADGILHVSAKDVQSGKEQKIRIEAKSGLSDAEIAKMVKDAEIHAEEDKLKKEVIDVKNEADALVFRAEKALKDYKDKVPAEVASQIQSKVDACKEALKKEDLDRIRSAKNDLEQVIQKIGESMQQQAGGATPPPGAQASQAKEEDKIEDAEVEILEDENKD